MFRIVGGRGHSTCLLCWGESARYCRKGLCNRRLRLLLVAAYSKFSLDESPCQEYNAKL